ncbi:MAG: hypothetical protein P1U32_06065 [Legionellaceae bacterium]|nr:hypothetical protein [Legionellaceae bacterium]
MPSLTTFIQPAFRPKIYGSMLDKHHKTYFFLKNNPKVSLHIHAICFGPKKDNVLINIEHAILKQDNVLVFYYEDIHKRWSYVETANTQYFIYQKSQHETLIVHPNCLYIRGCTIPPNTPMWKILGHFYTFADNWQGKILCAPKHQCTNESKPYQLLHSLKKAAQNNPLVSIGKSYIIKGPHLYTKKIKEKNCIVKSLSGIRSIVVDQTAFSQWDKRAIHHLPVLFQEKVNGYDVRTHVIQSKTFSKRAYTKDNVDYRYDKHFFKLQSIKILPNALKKFAYLVSKHESNLLIGLDFIKTAAGYVVLEANPSPGWSAYHECTGVYTDPFIQTLLKCLKERAF